MAYISDNLMCSWIRASFLLLSLTDLLPLISLPSEVTSRFLQWPPYTTILIGDGILKSNSSWNLEDYAALSAGNRITDFKNLRNSDISSTTVTVASIKELTSRGEMLLTSRKLHFVFVGEPNEFVLLISKSMNSFHHSWYIVLSDSDTKSSRDLPEWLKILQDLELGIDSDVLLGVWKSNVLQVFEVYKMCSQCPTTVYSICLVFSNQTVVGEKCNSSKYERRKNLQNIHLDVVAVDIVPFMTNVTPDANGIPRVTGGLFGALFTILTKELNISYTLRSLTGYQYGAFKNNSWNGMIGYLSRNEADMTVSEVSMAPDRLESIDYTSSFDTVGRKIYIRKVLESESINWKFYSAPFSPFLHISVVFWISMMMLLLWMAEFHEQRATNSQDFTLGETFWMAFSSICQKGAHILPEGRSSKMIFVVFSFTFLIIFCAYSATLISQLAVSPPVTVPFRDLQDFVKKAKNWKGGPIKGDLMQIYMEKTCPELLKNQKNGRNFQCELLVELWTKVIQDDKENLPLGFKSGLERVLRENFAFIATSAGTRFRIANDLNDREACSVLEMEGDYISSNLAFGLRKNNPYKKLINYKLLKLRKSGILKRLQKIWLPQRKQCIDQHNSEFNDATIYDVGVLPMIWIGGFLFSFIILFVELLIFRTI